MLQYPKDGIGDYITFVHFPYKDRKEAAPPSTGGIRLYMPNSTPAMNSAQNWGDTTKIFAGPAGAALREIAEGLTLDEGLGGSVKGTVDGFVAGIKKAKENSNEAIQQGAVGLIGTALGVSGNALTSISMGKTFNPNTELFYDGPALRSFNLSFNFVPKSIEEAQEVTRIIRMFKDYSAPDDTQNGMYGVPDVWQVRYYSKGRQDVLNRFKPAALSSVVVQANPGQNLHATFDDGYPLETSLGLAFREVELITRQDHVEVGGIGY